MILYSPASYLDLISLRRSRGIFELTCAGWHPRTPHLMAHEFDVSIMDCLAISERWDAEGHPKHVSFPLIQWTSTTKKPAYGSFSTSDSLEELAWWIPLFCTFSSLSSAACAHLPWLAGPSTGTETRFGLSAASPCSPVPVGAAPWQLLRHLLLRCYGTRQPDLGGVCPALS